MLVPPTPGELVALAERSRAAQPEPAPTTTRIVPMRSLRRRLPVLVIAELVTRYNAGEDTPVLSREYGISRTGLRQLLLAEEVALRRQAITAEEAEQAVRHYESGLTIRQILKQVGRPYESIRRALHEKGVAMRAGGGARCSGP